MKQVNSLYWAKLQGFPTGTRPGEQEPACVPNAKYTCGEFAVIKNEIIFGAIAGKYNRIYKSQLGCQEIG